MKYKSEFLLVYEVFMLLWDIVYSQEILEFVIYFYLEVNKM